MFTLIFVQPLFNILIALYALLPGHDFGVAVIGLTVLVRLALWPLVTRQLHSQKAMQRIQPDVNRIRAQYKDDRQKQTEALMELYKEKGVSPFSSILPILLQMPILFALVKVFSHSLHTDQINQLAYEFVKNIPFVEAIIKGQHHFDPTLFGLIDMTKPSLILAGVAAVAQFIQARQLQPNVAQAGDQAQIMRLMTYIFPVFIFVFALRVPSALALYWAATSVMASIQQYWVLSRDAHELEETAEAAEAKAAAVAAVAAEVAKPKPGAGAKKKSRKARRQTSGGEAK